MVDMYDILQLCDFGLSRKLSDISKTPSSLVSVHNNLHSFWLFSVIILNIINYITLFFSYIV